MRSRLFKLTFVANCLASTIVYAASPIIPSSADAERLITEEKITPITPKESDVYVPESNKLDEAPETTKKIHFTLKKVIIEGSTVFAENALRSLYISDLDKKLSVSVVWDIANRLTKKYRDAGYFLSKAYVPQQKIKNGAVIIKVQEAYITEVDLPEDMRKNKIIQTYTESLLKNKPTTIQKVEEFMLKLNDLPGYPCRSVLTKDEKVDGGVVLIVKKADSKTSFGTISYDNFSSRYNGVNEVKTGYTTVLAPMHQTTIMGSTSVPTNKATSGGIAHNVVIAPDLRLGFSATAIKTYPGYTLEGYDINSSANSTEVNLNYQFIRQRTENLSSKIAFNTINVNSNILGAPLSKDHIRAFRLGFDFNKVDSWKGINIFNLTLSRGVHILDASKAGEVYISRVGAKPNYHKLEISFSRIQPITEAWEATLRTNGQYTPNTLYSAEQFGYGGPSYGKAYDLSEITGDKGIAAAIELAYLKLNLSERANVHPYAFYDVGKVKNNYVADSTYSAASAGLGVRFATDLNQSGGIGLAWPLTRKASDPIYGHNHRSPRLMIQFSQGF